MTFCSRIKQRSGYEQTKKRLGSRAAYQQSAFYWKLNLTTPPHGDRPWEIAHIDHTQVDVELVCSRTGRNLGRLWATLLVDAYSSVTTQSHLTFHGMWKGEIGSRMAHANHCDFLYLAVSSTKSFKP
ncbi:hypothetical protein [Nostoc punctiforme]|uniref:hypothetical protein n=1 Tax=Nostoc punctiforme TaxID=272131 RepID=UPI003CC8AAA0